MLSIIFVGKEGIEKKSNMLEKQTSRINDTS